MPKWLSGRLPDPHTIVLTAALLAISAAWFVVSWWAGTLSILIALGAGIFAFRSERIQREQLSSYIATMSHRVKRATHEVISEMPLGIVLYDEEKKIEWHNPYIAKMMGRETLVGESVKQLWPALKVHKEKEGSVELALENQTFHVKVKPEERLLFFIDMTPFAVLSKKYEEEKISIGMLVLDNVDEVMQGMDDQARSVTMANVTTVINEWAIRHGLYVRKTSSERFLLLMSNRELNALEQSRFDVLDEVRDATDHLKLPMTLSIGVAGGASSLIELGQMAQTSLDIALGRGGDQAAVKVGDRMSFYGGRSNAVEKRTRVRARVVSHALRDLMQESENVVIMGHKLPDMDALGAAIGVLKASETVGIPGYIVLEGENPSIRRLLGLIAEDEHLMSKFITPEAALGLTSKQTLAIVVDTHKESMVAEPRLLHMTERVVVIDHHRRGEQFLSDATLIYMEPYASSTCELVTELLQYIHDGISMGVLESTALLAGIVTDTKSFSMRTGSRTFEAASFLRRNGADSVIVQRLMKDELPEYLKKAEIIRHAQIMFKHFAVAVVEPGQRHPQLLIAQVADTLLNMNGVEASFVISERTDGLIGISARSAGQINVQLIMEELGGGGHLSNAATQFDGTIEEAKEQLIRVLQQFQDREGNEE